MVGKRSQIGGKEVSTWWERGHSKGAIPSPPLQHFRSTTYTPFQEVEQKVKIFSNNQIIGCPLRYYWTSGPLDCASCPAFPPLRSRPASGAAPCSPPKDWPLEISGRGRNRQTLNLYCYTYIHSHTHCWQAYIFISGSLVFMTQHKHALFLA